MSTSQAHSEVRAIVFQVEAIAKNVLRKCKMEDEDNELELPLNDYEGRTANYTGLTRSYVHNLLHKEIKYESDQPFDVFERLLVMKALLQCYTAKKPILPTFKDVYQIVQESIKVKDLAHFRYQLTQMGFDYRKTTTGKVLAEDMKLTFERFHYIKKIRYCKSHNIPIYYIDERVIEETFPKPDIDDWDDNDKSAYLSKGYYFYHILSEKGLENYLFTNKKSKSTYMKWVFDVVVKLLAPVLIVIDDHPIHGELIENTITRYHSKSDMMNWLKTNGIPFGNTMHKAELFELISRSDKNAAYYKFDRLLKAHGFDVIRLPHGCKNLSPAALFWKDGMPNVVAPEIAEGTPMQLDRDFIPALTSLHRSTWGQLRKRITYWEEQFIDIDTLTATALEQICTFDVQNVENAQIPEYFYEIENL